MADEMELLKEWIKTSKNIVFFGGAGVSTESNIPDFRSTDGLYNQEYAYPPETILSHSFYKKKPEEFFRFYRNKMLFPNAQPNAAHKALARLEQQGKLKAVITQNIDGLHQKAGSREVLELHGSVLRNYCEHCGRFYSLEDLMEKKELVKLHEIEYELAQKGKQTIWGLTPTGALLAADLDDFHVDYYEAGRISTSTIAHSIAMQRVKVVGLQKGWTEWQSGRRLRQLAAKNKKTWLQVPDSVALSPDQKRTAFEIERTVKTPKRYEAILSNYASMFLDKTVDDVLYICPSNIAKRLEILFSKINKIVIDGKDYAVHENVRKRIKFLSYEDWSNS